MRIVKSEWHQVEKRYGMILKRELLDEIYPDLDSEEQDEIWQQILNNEYDLDELIEASNDTYIYLDWDWLDEDDWWTDRKGGYEVTYEIDPDYELPKTNHDFIRDLRNEVNELRTQLGLEEKYDTRPDNIRLAALKAEFDSLLYEDEKVNCFSCSAMHFESDLIEMSGQYVCPSCGEGWVMKEFREDTE
jgi:predicted RNA-binding Zn-ribbon protein involved in translation (DUF1610 family)